MPNPKPPADQDVPVDDCFAAFYAKHNACGFLADCVGTAARISYQGSSLKRLKRAAGIVVREAQRGKFSHEKQRSIAQRVGRLIDRALPIQASAFHNHFESAGILGTKGSIDSMNAILGIAATVLIDPSRKVHTRLMDPIVESLEAFGLPDEYMEEAGLRWKIRDWGGVGLAIPPYVRQAAAAAWEADEMELARELIERYIEIQKEKHRGQV
jgi:hypothetical protein